MCNPQMGLRSFFPPRARLNNLVWLQDDGGLLSNSIPAVDYRDTLAAAASLCLACISSASSRLVIR